MTKFEPLNIVRPLPLTVKDFLLLDSHGAFDGYGKTELIDGEIYFMNAQHRPHLMAKMILHNSLHAALVELGSKFTSVTEGTVEVGEHNAPEPDVILTSEPFGDGAIPVSSVGLVAEISDTTQKMDMNKKLRSYAEAGIPEYWVFDVKTKVLHQMWGPQDGQYNQNRQIPAGELITAKTIDGLTIRLPA